MKVRLLTALISLVVFPTATLADSRSPQKVAFVGGFTTDSPDNYLTDLYMTKGAAAFFAAYPKAKSHITLFQYDNHGKAETGIEIIRKIKESGVQFIIGFTKSDQAFVVTSLVEKNKQLLILPFATHPDLTKNLKYVFRTCASDAVLGQKLALFAKDSLKARRILVLRNVDSLYSQGMAKVFQEALDSTKIVTKRIDYSLTTLNEKKLVDTVAAWAPDYVFVPDLAGSVVALIDPIRRALPKIKYLGGDGWGDHDIMAGILKKYPDIEAYYTAHWHQDIKTKANADFTEAFKKLYGVGPEMQGAAIMFDALSVFWTAFRKSADSSSAEGVIQKLHSETFVTTTGAISFKAPLDNSPQRPVVIIKIENGNHLAYGTF